MKILAVCLPPVEPKRETLFPVIHIDGLSLQNSVSNVVFPTRLQVCLMFQVHILLPINIKFTSLTYKSSRRR